MNVNPPPKPFMSVVYNNFNTKADSRNLREIRLSVYEQSIREEERTRIAREIHDELGQWLTALKIEVHLIKKAITTEDTKTQQLLSSMISLVIETEKSVQLIATELRPCLLNNLGLAPAIEWHSKEFERRTNIQVQILYSGDLSLKKDISTVVFRVYQEALTNVARHSNATEVNTVLEQRNGHLCLVIKDNGQGFNPNELRMKSSLGLIGMQERALMLNGELSIESSKLNGTIIRLKIPLV